MENNKFKIEDNQTYNTVMKRIDELMKKGEEMSEKDATQLGEIAVAAQAYEKQQYDIPT